MKQPRAGYEEQVMNEIASDRVQRPRIVVEHLVDNASLDVAALPAVSITVAELFPAT